MPTIRHMAAASVRGPIVLLLLLSLLPRASRAQSCELEWSDQFPAGTLNNIVHALCVFDEDGDGPDPPALFAGGSFTMASGNSASRIARWDGTSWSSLGLGVGNAVFALIVFDDDDAGPNPPALYVAGNFTWAGTGSANRIAKWDGASWSVLGNGLNGVTYGLAVFDDDGDGPNLPALYAGGIFSAAGGVLANRVARWDGTTWSALDDGLDNYVNTLAVFDEDDNGPLPPVLYVGGGFTAASGIAASRIARWDGTSWSHVKGGPTEPDGVNGIVYDLTVFDEDGAGPGLPGLYVGGYFTTAGLISANRIVKWDGAAWSALGDGVGSPVWALEVFDDHGGGPESGALYAGGAFTTAGAVGANYIARWDGSVWSPLGDGLDAGVRAMAVFDADGAGPYLSALYVGGSFSTAGGLPSDHIARWGCPLTASPPVVAVHPESQTICDGSSVTFNVSAWGTEPLSYQWRKDGVDVEGAVDTSYTIGSVGPDDVGDYDVVVTNDFGTATSNPATLTLGVAPTIVQQSHSQSLCLGDPVTFSVVANGLEPLSYQWYRDGLIIYGATYATYAIDAAELSDAGAYTVVVGNECGVVSSDAAMLTVYLGPVILEQPQSQEVCDGGAVTFDVDVFGLEPVTYQWRKDGSSIGGATGSAYSIDPVEPADAGEYDVVVTSACGWVASDPATLTIRSGPNITEQPQSQEVCADGVVTFGVTANGVEPLSYQWRKAGQVIDGATSASYTIDPVELADAGEYDVVVTSACGSLASDAATLTVHTDPVILEQPQSQEVCEGGAVTFEVAVSGIEPLTYQWYKDGQAIDGAVDTWYAIDPVTPADAGDYDVEVTDACGMVVSDAATLALGFGPTITQQPLSQEVCEGDAVTFEVAASGLEPLTYEWRKDGVVIDGATDAWYTIDPLTPADAGVYDVEVTSACGSVTSAAATLTVDTDPVILAQPQSQGVCDGGAVTFEVIAGGSEPLSYQWRKDGQAINGATDVSYVVDPVSADDAGEYDVVVANVCGPVTSEAAALTVHTGPAIIAEPQTQSACEGGSVTFDVTASGLEPLTYQWLRDGQVIDGATGASYVIDPVGLADAGDYDVEVTSACGSATSGVATLTVTIGMDIVQQPQSQGVCAGDAVTFSVTASGPEPLSYQWRKDGQAIDGATGTSYVLDPAAEDDGGDYDVEVTGTCGSVVSDTATLTVDTGPAIVRQPQARSLCAGDAVTLSVTVSGSAPLTYQWRKDGRVIAGAIGGSCTLDPVSIDDVGEYDVTVTNACGIVTSNTALLTVDDCINTPGVPAGPKPANAASAVPVDVELGWEDMAEAASYDVYFGTQSPPALLGNTAANRWGVSNLAYGRTYYWRIVAQNEAGATTGPLWSFRTVDAPGGDDPDPNDQDPGTSGQDPPSEVLPEEIMPAGCGAGACGVGYIQIMPLTILGLLGMKRRYRRRG